MHVLRKMLIVIVSTIEITEEAVDVSAIGGFEFAVTTVPAALEVGTLTWCTPGTERCTRHALTLIADQVTGIATPDLPTPHTAGLGVKEMEIHNSCKKCQTLLLYSCYHSTLLPATFSLYLLILLPYLPSTQLPSFLLTNIPTLLPFSYPTLLPYSATLPCNSTTIMYCNTSISE